MLARVCTGEGHEVCPFTSSPEALIALATEPFDLLMTDMNMPDPDGVTVIREARRLQPDIFTLVITGHAGHYPLAEIVVTGTADVMFKPFHMAELRARLALTRQRMHAHRPDPRRAALAARVEPADDRGARERNHRSQRQGAESAAVVGA